MKSAIDAMFVSGLTPRRWRQVREHLYACQSCRSYYDRVMGVARRLEGGEGALTATQLRLVGDLVVAKAEAERSPVRRALLRFVPYGALAAAAVLAIAVVPPLQQRLGDGDSSMVADGSGAANGATSGTANYAATSASGAAGEGEFQARGLTTESGAGVRAVCVATAKDGRAVVRGIFPNDDVAGSDAERCRLDDVLHFTYANAVSGRDAFAYLFVLGVDAQLEPHWYYPQHEEARSLAIEGGAAGTDRQLPGGIALAKLHRSGALRVYALFSHEPVSVETIETRLTRWREEGTSFARLPALGIEGTEESSFVINLEE